MKHPIVFSQIKKKQKLTSVVVKIDLFKTLSGELDVCNTDHRGY